MTVIDDLLANNARYAETFDRATCPYAQGSASRWWGVWRPLRPAQAAGDQ